jgi:hypothetical protein
MVGLVELEMTPPRGFPGQGLLVQVVEAAEVEPTDLQLA